MSGHVQRQRTAVEEQSATYAHALSSLATQRSIRILCPTLGVTIRSCDRIVDKAQDDLVASLGMTPQQMKAWVATLSLRILRDSSSGLAGTMG